MTAPHQGRSLEPGRSVEFEGTLTHEVDPAELSPPSPMRENPTQPTPPVQASPPPQEPTQAARTAEWQREKGELLRQMGEREKAFERRMQEMQMNFDVTMAAAQQGQGAIPPAQANGGVDPEAPVRWGDLQGVLADVPAITTMQAIRATWDVTPAEETAAMQSNPAMQQLREPTRTQMIQRQVAFMRANQSQGNGGHEAAVPGSQAVPPTQAPPVTPQVLVPVDTPMVPVVETSGLGASPADPTPNDALLGAQREYEQAKTIKNKAQRHAAMKKAWEKTLALQGVSHEGLSNSSFTVT